MEDMGGEIRSGKVRSRGKEAGTGEVSQIDKGVWEETVRKNADEESVELCDRSEEGICTTKRKGIPTIERRERGGKEVCKRAAAKGIYSTIKDTANSAGILCREERWKEADGAKL